MLLNPFQMELLGSQVKHISRACRLIQRKGNERVWGEEKGSTGWRKAGSATNFDKLPREWDQRRRTGSCKKSAMGLRMWLGKWNWKTVRRVRYFLLDFIDGSMVIYIFQNRLLYFKYVWFIASISSYYMLFKTSELIRM